MIAGDYKTCVAQLLRAAPHWAIAAATIWFLVAHREATSSLQDALGDFALWWQIALALTHLAVGVLIMVPERVRVLRVLGWFHVLAATTLAGYTLGIVLTPPTTGESIVDLVSTAVGLAVGAMILHLLRWRQIETDVIPTVRTLGRLAAEHRAKDVG